MSEKEKPVTPKKKGLSPQTIIIIILLCLVVIIPSCVFLWKQIEIIHLNKKHDTEMSALRTNASTTMKDVNKKNMETLARVFSWAVRSEMLRNNMDQVSTYMTELVKAADLNDISAIKTDGIVALSTNKKYEGNTYPGPVASQLSTINEVVSQTGNDASVMIICPIMGLDSRLGTIVITYKPTVYTFGNNE